MFCEDDDNDASYAHGQAKTVKRTVNRTIHAGAFFIGLVLRAKIRLLIR